MVVSMNQCAGDKERRGAGCMCVCAGKAERLCTVHLCIAAREARTEICRRRDAGNLSKAPATL